MERVTTDLIKEATSPHQVVMVLTAKLKKHMARRGWRRIPCGQRDVGFMGLPQNRFEGGVRPDRSCCLWGAGLMAAGWHQAIVAF